MFSRSEDFSTLTPFSTCFPIFHLFGASHYYKKGEVPKQRQLSELFSAHPFPLGTELTIGYTASETTHPPTSAT